MDGRTVFEGRVAARIDRLPLTRVQWQLAVLVEITWGFIIFDTHMLLKRHTYNEYVVAAISLYLDVINLFLSLMTLFRAAD